MLPPRSFASPNSLPPEGAARLRPGEAGSAAQTYIGGGFKQQLAFNNCAGDSSA